MGMQQVYGVITCCFSLGLNSKFSFFFFDKNNNIIDTFSPFPRNADSNNGHTFDKITSCIERYLLFCSYLGLTLGSIM